MSTPDPRVTRVTNKVMRKGILKASVKFYGGLFVVRPACVRNLTGESPECGLDSAKHIA